MAKADYNCFVIRIGILLFKKRLIDQFEREREKDNVGGGQRKRERETREDSTLSTEPSTGLDLMTLRSGPEPNPSWTLNSLHHPGAPGLVYSFKMFHI